jgi:hypothetical protein
MVFISLVVNRSIPDCSFIDKGTVSGAVVFFDSLESSPFV